MLLGTLNTDINTYANNTPAKMHIILWQPVHLSRSMYSSAEVSLWWGDPVSAHRTTMVRVVRGECPALGVRVLPDDARFTPVRHRGHTGWCANHVCRHAGCTRYLQPHVAVGGCVAIVTSVGRGAFASEATGNNGSLSDDVLDVGVG